MDRRRISNAVFYTINAVSLLVALAALSASLWFRFGSGASRCQRAIRGPLLEAGLVLFVVSVLGWLGSCCRNKVGFVLYFVAMALLVSVLCMLAVFVLVITNRSAARRVKGWGVGDYSGWLRKHFIYGEHWEQLRSCLAESNVCGSIQSHEKFSESMRQNISPVQSGCCKPPVYCGFIYKNMTYWEEPKVGPKAAHSDCQKWENNKEKLCYACDSCKRGVLFSLKKEWRLWALLNITSLLLILITLNIAACACRNNQTNRHFRANKAIGTHPLYSENKQGTV